MKSTGIIGRCWISMSKALRFVHAVYGRRYVASHGKLRLILFGYLGLPLKKSLISNKRLVSR